MGGLKRPELKHQALNDAAYKVFMAHCRAKFTYETIGEISKGGQNVLMALDRHEDAMRALDEAEKALDDEITKAADLIKSKP